MTNDKRRGDSSRQASVRFHSGRRRAVSLAPAGHCIVLAPWSRWLLVARLAARFVLRGGLAVLTVAAAALGATAGLAVDALAQPVAAPAASAPAAAPPDTPPPAAAPTDAAPADAAPAAPKPRSLRNPLPDLGALPPPTVPEVFTGSYPGALPYTIVPRKPELPLHPCVMCHNLRKPDPTIRVFKVAPPPDGAPHAGVLRHGKGRIWCLDCHHMNDREYLRTVDNRKLDFNDGPLQCGQCHSARYRDWVFGGHGKRVAGWNGERQLYSCMHCHDPHVPVLPPRPPSKAPPVRAGLQPMLRAHGAAPGPVPTAQVAPAAPLAAPAAPAPAAPAAAQGHADGKEAKR
jgi:hypothetical protein